MSRRGPATRPVASPSSPSPLAQRVRTAIVLLAGLLLLLFALPATITVAVATLVVALGAWEWAGLARLQWPGRRLAFVAAVLCAIAIVLILKVGAPSVLAASVVWWFAALVLVMRAPAALPRPLVLLAGMLALVPAWVALAALLGLPEHGPGMLLLGLAMVFAADIGAYFAGRRFGRVKLAPRVSPGKTWEGLLGGLASAMLVAGLGGLALDLPPAVMVPLGGTVGAISVVGDLTESLFKRGAGLKDSGQLLPGHGGILDRIDGVVAGLPLFVLALIWLGRLPA